MTKQMTLQDIRDAFKNCLAQLHEKYSLGDPITPMENGKQALQALDTLIEAIPDALGDAICIDKDLISAMKLSYGEENIQIAFNRYEILNQAAKLLHDMKPREGE